MKQYSSFWCIEAFATLIQKLIDEKAIRKTQRKETLASEKTNWWAAGVCGRRAAIYYGSPPV